MSKPITKRVSEARSYNFPVNQEVTMNADGSGGPISIAKKKGPCWSGYEMIGMKKKGGKKVPNCVPKNKKK